MAVTPVMPKFFVKYDGANIGVYHAANGEGLPKHSHEYAHLTMCVAGRVVIRKENAERVIDKDTKPISLKAAEWHEIEALENGTIFVNIFAEGK